MLKLCKLEEKDKFLETYTMPRLSQTEIWTKLITGSDIGFVIKKFHENESLGQKSFNREFYLIHKEELISILLKLFRNIEEEGMPPTHYMTQHYSERKTRYDTHKTHTHKQNLCQFL